MRISNYAVKIIKHYAKIYFGDNAEVYLFGSRTNDLLKGGDIDLLIETTIPKEYHLEKKLEFLTRLQLKLGFQKIDVVIQDKNQNSKKDIVKIAEQKGERIC